MNCKHCGGKLMGDGFTEVLHCEHVYLHEPITPDSDPIFCYPKDHECVEPDYEDTWSAWDRKVFDSLPDEEAKKFSKII